MCSIKQATVTVLLVALLAAGRMAGAQTVIDHSQKTEASTAGATVAVTGLTSSNAGDFYAIGLLGDSTNDLLSCTDNGGSHATYTRIAGTKSTSGAFWSVMAYAENAPAGITSVTCTMNVSAAYRALFVWHVSGMATASSLDTQNQTASTGSCTTCTGPAATTTNATDFVASVVGPISGTCASVTANPTGGNEFTAGGDIDAGGALASSGSAIVSATGSHSYQWTYNAACTAIGSIAAWKKLAASGVVPTRTLVGVGP